MPAYRVAHIKEQGVDMIIVPLDRSFGTKDTAAQQKTMAALQACASRAGLKGAVALVWDAGGGRMAFLAPRNWHAFFSSIDLGFVGRNINRELRCG